MRSCRRDVAALALGAACALALPRAPLLAQAIDLRAESAAAAEWPLRLEEPRLRHASGGWRFTAVLGDSADHTRHNAANVMLLSTGLLAFLWWLPDDFPRFDTPDPRLSQWVQAYTRPPVMDDGDWWVWNWIAHPLVGTHQYLLERNWGTSRRRAFAFSAAASIVWEYGFESSLERPSVPDLLLTAPVGMVLGEAVYQATMRMRRNGFSRPEKLAVLVLNPVYVLQHGFR